MLIPATVQEGQTGRIAETNLIYSLLRQMRYANDPTYGTLQDCIDDTPNGGVVLFPRGVTSFEAIDTGSKILTFSGYGGMLAQTPAAGSAAWLDDTKHHGSILRSTATEGVAIDASGGILQLENLALVGANGQTTGVHVGNVELANRGLLHWRNVQIGNFAVGALIDNGYENTFEAVVFRGCVKGLHLFGANASMLIRCSVSVAEIGIHLDGAANNSILGGAVQGCTDVGVLVDASEECTLQGIYFENANGNYAVDTVGISDRLLMLNCHTSTPEDRVRINSNHCHIWHGKSGNESSQDPSNLILTGDYNTAYVSSNHGDISNTGTDNIIRRVGDGGEILEGNGDIIFDSSRPVLVSPDGSRFVLKVSDAGVLSTEAL